MSELYFYDVRIIKLSSRDKVIKPIIECVKGNRGKTSESRVC